MEFEHEFEAVLEAEQGEGGVFVVVPFSVPDTYDTKDELPVHTSLDGFPYRGSLHPLGDGHHALTIPREVRRALGKTIGDTLHVALRPDTDPPRQVELPDDLAAALAAAPAAQRYFQSLSFTDQRDYTRWLQGAKKPEARAKRLTETLYRLGQGLKRA